MLTVSALDVALAPLTSVAVTVKVRVPARAEDDIAVLKIQPPPLAGDIANWVVPVGAFQFTIALEIAAESLMLAVITSEPPG